MRNRVRKRRSSIKGVATSVSLSRPTPLPQNEARHRARGVTGERGSYPRVSTNRVPVQPQRIVPQERDPIHAPLIESYRRETGLPPGGVDEFGSRVGPSDAQLKYSGLLVQHFAARWLPPIIHQQNAAEAYFKSTALIDPPGGLTTQFINGKKIESNLDVEAAVPQPNIQSRTEKGRTYCWFDKMTYATGRTRMDIFTPGPWNYSVSKNQAAAKYPWEQSCKTGGGSTNFHVDGKPNDKALEEYIRKGEGEHNTDSRAAFYKNIVAYVHNVNRYVGDTPTTRVEGKDLASCKAKLRKLENRGLLTQFVRDLNASTAKRHAGGRHSAGITGLKINKNCTRVTVTMEAGKL